MMEIGELRRQLSLDAQQQVERIIDHKKNLESYYILIYARARDDNVIESKFVLMSQKPEPMLGTICLFVDNRTGELWRLWSLPRDMPRPDDLIDGDSMHAETGESARKLGPIAVLNQ